MPLKKRVAEKNNTGISGHKQGGARKVISQKQYEKQLAKQNKKSKKIKAVPKKKPVKPKPIVQPVIKPVAKSEPVPAVAKAMADKEKSPTMLQSSLAKKASDDAKAVADKQKKIEADKKAASLAKIMADKKKAADLAKAQAAKAAASSFAKATADKKKIADKKIADAAAAKKALDAKLLADKQKKLKEQKEAEDKKIVDAADKAKAIEEKITKQADIVKKEIVTPKVEPVAIASTQDENKQKESDIHEEKNSSVEDDMSDDVSAEAMLARRSFNEGGAQDDDYIDLDNISFVGSHDLEMMQIKEQIQGEIVKYYKPPVGISKKAVCELTVVVGVGGKAERVTVKKSSGSVANDICARAALLKVKFPKEVIGKEIIVALGQ